MNGAYEKNGVVQTWHVVQYSCMHLLAITCALLENPPLIDDCPN